MSYDEDTYLDIGCSEEEDDTEPYIEENTSKKNSQKFRKAAPGTKNNEPAICGFCHKPSTLKIGGKSYLCKSRTMPHLRICNACKSYEYRHGVLIARDQRKNKSRKRRIDSDGPARKRQYYDPVEDNSQEVESEPELYPFARADSPSKKIRTVPKPPACVLQMRHMANTETVRIPTSLTFDTPSKLVRLPSNKSQRKVREPYREQPSRKGPKKSPLPSLYSEEDLMDIENSESEDLACSCSLCKKQVKEDSQLIMCGSCDKIFHKDCYAVRKTDYTILRPYGSRSSMITCADHKFQEERFGRSDRGKPPMCLPTLKIPEFKEPTKPTLTLSDLCFDSIDETHVVITPEYVSQVSMKSHQNEFSDENCLHQLDQHNLNMINPFLFGEC